MPRLPASTDLLPDSAPRIQARFPQTSENSSPTRVVNLSRYLDTACLVHFGCIHPGRFLSGCTGGGRLGGKGPQVLAPDDTR